MVSANLILMAANRNANIAQERINFMFVSVETVFNSNGSQRSV